MWINCVLTIYPGAIACSLLRAYVHLVVLSMPSINTSVRISNHPTYNDTKEHRQIGCIFI
jgi:hypothetical protein